MESLIKKLTNKYICLYNLFIVRGLDTKDNYSKGVWQKKKLNTSLEYASTSPLVFLSSFDGWHLWDRPTQFRLSGSFFTTLWLPLLELVCTSCFCLCLFSVYMLYTETSFVYSLRSIPNTAKAKNITSLSPGTMYSVSIFVVSSNQQSLAEEKQFSTSMHFY